MLAFRVCRGEVLLKLCRVPLPPGRSASPAQTSGPTELPGEAEGDNEALR